MKKPAELAGLIKLLQLLLDHIHSDVRSYSG
jgi:hypothetical protein